MAFPPRFMDELVARSDIVDVIGSYVALKPRGGSYWACCPFHNEKTPSFHVVPDKQLYYCFGCKKGGGVISFIMEEENLPYPDAVRFLAKRAGMEVPEEEGDREAGKRRARILELNREAARFYYQMLQSEDGRAVRDYLARRRIRRATAVKFGMGASADTWDSLLTEMIRRGYSKQDLLDAGLVVQNQEGRLRDKFRNRLMLPVIDTRGDVVAFGSRVLDKSEPKYMNSSDTPVYSKRRTLYGLNLARKTKRPNIILCEGNLDIVTLHQAGFDNAVASMGTALTPEQVRLLSRFTKELVLCYDNDSAGKTATEKALDLLRPSELSVRVLQLPRRMVDGELVKQDADDFIKYQGPAAFERLLSGSEKGTEFQLDELAAKYDLKSDEGRAAYGSAVSRFIASLGDSTEQEVYLHRAAELSGIPAEAIALDVRRLTQGRQPGKSHRKGGNNTPPEKDMSFQELNPTRQFRSGNRELRYDNIRSAQAEEGLIRILLMDDTLFPSSPPLSEDQFSSPLLGKAFQILWKCREEGRPVSLSALDEACSPEEVSHIAAFCQKPQSSRNLERALEDYIRVVQEESGKREAQAGDPLLAAVKKYQKFGRDGGRTP